MHGVADRNLGRQLPGQRVKGFDIGGDGVNQREHRFRHCLFS